MRWLNVADAWLDQWNWTSVFQVAVMLIVLVKIFTVQTSDRLDMIVERTPVAWGWLRRALTIIECMAWLWVVLYYHEANEEPSPPLAWLAMAAAARTGAQLVIVQMDYIRSKRLGGHVAGLSDALPSIKRSAGSAYYLNIVSRTIFPQKNRSD